MTTIHTLKLYPISYISEATYRKYEKKLMQLGEAKKAQISFDVGNQHFVISSRSEAAVDETMKQITYSLLPHLDRNLDEDMLGGTFQTIEEMDKKTTPTPLSSSPSPSPSSPATAATPEATISTSTTEREGTATPMTSRTDSASEAKTVVGRPFGLGDLDEEEDKVASFDALDCGDTDATDSEEEAVEGVFEFSKNIKDPADVLKGVNPMNGQAVDYCKVVGMDTDTTCELEGRTITIKGYCEPDIKEAVQRFRNIQKLYKARRRPPIVVPCVHYPTHSSHYELYFCDLSRYAHKAFVDRRYADALPPCYVLLPVFKDEATGHMQKPKDLLDIPTPRSAPVALPLRRPPSQQYQQPMTPPAAVAAAQRAAAPRRPSYNSSPMGQAVPPRPMAAYRQPVAHSVDNIRLWGEDRGFSNHYAASNSSSHARMSPGTPRPSSNMASSAGQYSLPTSPTSPASDHFPSLPSGKAYPTPTMAPPQQPPARRVMRITRQQSSSSSSVSVVSNSKHAPVDGLTLLEQAKQYNLHNMQKGLSDALDGIRGFRGEIQLSAKLGKVLWTNLTSDIQRKTWEFRDIKDVVVKEHGVRPLFNDVTTAYEDIITRISEILPKPFSRTACFEIHARARNQPLLPYKPVVLTMNQGIVEFKKVVTRSTKVAEIDWVSLDRKFDFQMSLTTQELGRTDVKPYTTFVRKISVCPITSQLTFENVKDFLTVDHILYKQKTRYRIHFPFVVEITRVERVPIKLQPSNGYGTEKYLGMTGKGDVWYDFQVFYTVHDEAFKSNINLAAGKLPAWNVETILGANHQALIDYVKCLLLLVEKCEPLFDAE